ncbi:acyl-CoA dehydrogenase family protein [Arvimicrobium flavum]|uniref:acyl-CoA dehydrogenase family protein n=1 Tax=Arvimicrobium flavum TaxID=3393320 RepID=UPI00237C2886|nr:acyl-CoA dehydrogenase [Mesorhizobium shangrilense]
MDYSFDSETQMLAESVARFVKDHTEAPGDLWPTIAELGWLGLPLPEAVGGIGLGGIGAMVVMEGLGAGSLAVPFIPSVVMAGGVLARSPAHSDTLSSLIEGRSRITAACAADPEDVKAIARPNGDHYRLSGSGILVLDVDGADAVVVPARLDNSSDIALFLVPLDGSGVELRAMTLADGRAAARLNMADASLAAAQRIEVGADGRGVLAATRDAALLAAAAENLGAMQTLFDLTLEYAKTRKQFGRAIGSFQVLQFRLVDLWIKLDEARSLVMTATMAADEGHADAAGLAAAAWIQTLWSGKAICEEAIQIHGAIGMTDECVVGRYVKRILVNELVYGPAERHLARYRSLQAA